jgi:hypothetical protein
MKEIRQVDPVTARLGHFLETFPCTSDGRTQMMNFAIEAAKAAKRNRIKGEVVYTKMNRWGYKGHDTWQVFFLRK